MDRVRAGRVFVARGALADPRTALRVERMLAGIDAPVKEVVDDARIDQLQAPFLRDRGDRGVGNSPPSLRSTRKIHRHKLERRGFETTSFADRVLFLDRMRWDRPDGISPGYGPSDLRSAHREWDENRVVCQSAVELETVVGCAFDCSYCPYTHAMTLTCDLERFVEHVEGELARRPHQALYKLNNRSDTLCFEPEYGLARLLVERFARTEDKFLMLYSKSDNVDSLLSLDHRGHTIACFTLSSPSAAARLEPSAPPPAARIAAAKKCQAAGYPVRFRFSPIVPLRGWREELDALVRAMAAEVEPELITLWTLSMTELAELGRIVPLDALDPRFLDEARRAEPAMIGEKGAPFPSAARTELYEATADAIARWSPRTRVALCLETPRVIDRLAGRLAIVGRSQVCNCGPQSTPDRVGAAPAAAEPGRRDRVATPHEE